MSTLINQPISVVVHEAIQEVVANKTPLHTFDFTTLVKEAFVDDVFAILPESFGRKTKIQYCEPIGGGVTEAVQKKCLDCSAILEIGGRNRAVIRLLPPLIVTKQQLDEALVRFKDVIKDAVKKWVI
ncbi:hypothetical protein [Oceanobacillus senegalensis]|uniref:hypothetical protein n=1 Tax=Oceanobacillus senegalensis TaxID=1936063 RepID=UPI000A30D215|nr:hypothetical protein [Oceanobacillus senegalensis]